MIQLLRYLVLIMATFAFVSACQNWKDLNKDREPDPREEQKDVERKRAQFFKSSPPPLDRPEEYLSRGTPG